MLARVDEVLLTKASKVSVKDVYRQLDDYVLNETFEVQNKTTTSEIQDTLQQIQGIRDDIDEMNKQFAIEIQSSMKKIVFSLNSEMNTKMNKEGVSAETVGDMISDKIDRVEFYSSLDTKSNKQDLEWTIKSIEVLHRQIKNVISLLSENIYQSSEIYLNTSESDKAKYEKRISLWKQTLRVSKWINVFDPSNINMIGPNNLTNIETNRSQSLIKRKLRQELIKNYENLFINSSNLSSIK